MLAVSSQRKVGAGLVPSLLLACFALQPKTAFAAGPPAAGPGSGALPPPPPAPATDSAAPSSASGAPQVSPFTGDDPGPAPLPAAPLPAAPPPKSALGSVSPPGGAGSDLPRLPAPPRGARYHDGFYLRMALGLSASGVLVSSDSTSVPNYSFAGGGAAADLWLGGTPSAGLAMGGALSVLTATSTRRRVDGESRSGDVSGALGLLGLFVDGFPDPERGFHFGGTLGLASADAKVKGSTAEFKGGGVGLAGWLGYDLFVSPQWSLGGMLRFMGSLSRETREDVNYQTSFGGASLSFTALYH